MIDVNVHISRWPFRRVRGDDTAGLVRLLTEQGVTEAWAGSFDALLHRDVEAVNAKLVEECKRAGQGMLIPFGTVNPTLPDWKEDVARCHERHRMPGIRLYPGYHGYPLDSSEFHELLRLAAERKLIVQVAVSMEDPRTQHPLIAVKPVDLRPLAAAINQAPAAKVVLLNAFHGNQPTSPPLADALAAGDVYVEIATLEGLGGVERLLKSAPLPRVLFGSHAPFFHASAAALKLRESELAQPQRAAIERDNARRLLPRSVNR